MALEWLLLFLLAIVVFYPSLLVPFVDIDEAIWAEFANAVLKGCPPYVCVIGEKPPLLYLFYTAVFSLFGPNNYFFLHFIHILWVSLTAFLLNRIFPSEKSSWLPGVFYILLLGLPGFTMLAATGESLMNPFLILSWILFLRFLQVPSFWKVLAIGILIGVASLFRLQAGIQLVVYSGLVLFKKWEVSWRRFIPLLILGFVAVWFLAFLVLWQWGSWESFKQWGIVYSLGYVKSGTLGAGIWKSSLKYLVLLFGSTLVFWVLLFFGWFRENSTPSFLKETALAYLLGALLAASVGFRFYPHYFIQSFPPLAVLATLGFQKLREDPLRPKFYKTTKACLWIFFAAILIQHFFFEQERALDSSRDYEAFNQKVGQYIRARTQPGDTIYVWGWGNGIYYYADRRVATRFVHSDFLSGRVSLADPARLTTEEALENLMPGVWEAFMNDLEENRPVYIVDTSPAGIHEYQHFPVSSYPVLRDFLAKDYHFEKEIEGIRLYRINEK